MVGGDDVRDCCIDHVEGVGKHHQPRIAHIRRLERRVVTMPGSVKVVMRNVLLGSVGAPLPGGLSYVLRTPLT